MISKEDIAAIVDIDLLLIGLEKNIWGLEKTDIIRLHNSVQGTMFRLRRNMPKIRNDYVIICEVQRIINTYKIETQFLEFREDMLLKYNKKINEDNEINFSLFYIPT